MYLLQIFPKRSNIAPGDNSPNCLCKNRQTILLGGNIVRKRIFAAVLLLAMLLSVASCGNGGTAGGETNTPSGTASQLHLLGPAGGRL